MNIIIHNVFRKILEHVIAMKWTSVVFLSLMHAVTSYWILIALGEGDLIEKVITFVYFYQVSASTVGYGDLSPSTDWGRIAVAFYVLPGANMAFMMVVTKIIASINEIVRETMSGLGNFEGRKGHFVIVGYQARKTERLVAETEDMHRKGEVVIISKLEKDTSGIQATPIKATELSSLEALRRAGVATAKKVVVLAEDDAETLAASLAISYLKPKGHVVAYFETREQADLLKQHCSSFECVVSTSIEQLSRAMTDPGAASVLEDLSSKEKKSTLLSIEVPEAAIIDLKTCKDMMEEEGANLVCFREIGAHENDYDVFKKGKVLQPGASVYYVGEARLDETFIQKVVMASITITKVRLSKVS